MNYYPLSKLIHIKHGFAFKSEFFSMESGSHIVLTPGNFNENGGFRLRPDKDRFYLGDYPKEFLLEKNDLIVAMTEQTYGLLGSPALIPESNKYLHNQRLGKVEILSNRRIEKLFLYYLFFLPFIRDQISVSASGTKIRHTSPDRICSINIPLPPLPIQKKIAAILSAYDDLIENNKRRIAILEKMAEELYREWFVRLRFPGHEGVKIEKGVPEGWEVKRIGEITEYQIGGGWGSEAPTGSDNVPVYVIRGTDFKNIENGDFTSVPLRFENASSVESRSLRHGDIILENSVNAQSRSTGNSILITEKILEQYDNPVIPASFCKLLRLNNPDLSFYIWKNLRSIYLSGLMESFQNIATNGIANFQITRFLQRFFVIIPCDKKITNSFWAYDSSKYLVIQTKLMATRDRLLSRLMSGKIDVEDLDIKFPPSMEEEEAARA